MENSEVGIPSDWLEFPGVNRSGSVVGGDSGMGEYGPSVELEKENGG